MYHLDPNLAYKLLAILPLIIGAFFLCWTKLVARGFIDTSISVEEAYLDAIVNEELVHSTEEEDDEEDEVPKPKSKNVLNAPKNKDDIEEKKNL